MKKKKLISLVLAGTMVFGLAACGSNGGDKKSEGNSDSDKVVKVAVVETAYGADMWNDVAAAFEKETGVKVELTIDKNIEDIIQPQMKSGEYPDVIMRAVGSESAITETFIKDNNVEELTDVLDMTVPGEDAKVGDKILPGFTENSIVNPYGDGKTYLMPMFYSPCGLFYDANLFKTKDGMYRRHGMTCGHLLTRQKLKESHSSHILQQDTLMHSSMHYCMRQWDQKTSQRL